MPTATHIDGGTVTNATSVTTASGSPTSNSLQLFLVTVSRGGSTQPTAPTVTGCGLTWVQVGTSIDIDTVGTARQSVFLFRALGAASAGAVTATLGYTCLGAAYEWDEVPGVDTAGTNGSGAVVQAVQASGNSSNPNVTLAAFASSENSTYGGSGAQRAAAATPQGTGFTELGHDEVTATVTVGTISEFRTDNDTTVDTNIASGPWGIFGLELKAETNPTLAGKGTAAAGATNTLKLTAALAGKGTAAASPRAALSVNGASTQALTGKGTAASSGRAVLGIAAKLTAKGTAASGGRAWLALPTDSSVAAAVYGTTFNVPDLSAPIDLLEFTEASWQEQLSDTGAGQITIQNDLTQPSLGQLVGMHIEGRIVWTMILEKKLKKTVEQGEEAEEVSVYSGPGHMALWKRALTYPALGLESLPKQHDMFFDYTHPEYDDWWWVGPNWFDHNQLVNEWGTDFGAWAADFPDTDALGLCAPADTLVDAPEGRRYGRQSITIPSEDDYRLAYGGDNTIKIFIDGCQVVNETRWSNFGTVNEVQVRISAGTHLVAWEFENKPWVTGDNPTASRWSILTMAGTVIEHSDTSAVVLGPVEMSPAPDDPPGMSPGNAIRLWLEAAQARGCLTYITLGFDDIYDSAGEIWAPGTNSSGSGIHDANARISTKILTDGLTFLREISATYCDFRMSPDGFVLYAYNKGTYNYTSAGQSWTPTNDVTVLEQTKEFQIANVLVGEYNDLYLEDTDATSIATYERIEGRLAIGADNGADEAQRVLDEALALYANPREELNIQVDGPVGYIDYDLGQLIDTVDSDGNAISERVMAITVSIERNIGRVLTTPTVKDLLLDSPSGLTQATNKMIPGT